jgi:hypothetical protein
MSCHLPRGRARSVFLIFFLATGACGDGPRDSFVKDSIEAHGGDAYESVFVEFDFRGRHYTATRDKGLFTYTREFTDSTGRIKDVLTNGTFTRYRDGSVLPITEERKHAFTNSVNSVIYFALLPYFLGDQAVRSHYVGQTKLEGKTYNLVRVTFGQEHGGEDHQDVFLYWFSQTTRTMDYFAYTYQTDGGGLRFRKAVNARRVGGILFQDYINYEPADEQVTLDQLQSLFEKGQLRKLSDIRLENIRVRHLP